MWDDHPIFRWPVRDPGLANDIGPGQHPPAMGITGIGAVISQDKVLSRADGHRAPGVSTDIGGVRLFQPLAVDENSPLFDLQVFAREPNDSLDELTVGVSGEVKDNDVPSLRGMEPIGELADDQVLTIVQVWLHAGSFNAKLLDEEANHKEDEQGEDDCLYNLTQEGFDTPLLAGRSVGCFFWELGKSVRVGQLSLVLSG